MPLPFVGSSAFQYIQKHSPTHWPHLIFVFVVETGEEGRIIITQVNNNKSTLINHCPNQLSPLNPLICKTA